MTAFRFPHALLLAFAASSAVLAVIAGVVPEAGRSHSTARNFHSSDLNWQPGGDVTDEFARFAAKTIRPGENLVLDHMYILNAGAGIQLPDGVTLAARNGGGFDLQNTDASDRSTILMGNGGTLNNITITASGAPDTDFEGLKPERGVDFHRARAIGISGVDNVTVINSTFSGNIGQFLDVHDSANLIVEGTHFTGARAQLRMSGDVADALIYRSRFEGSVGDGIKTLDGDISGTRVIESLFENNTRDGIDTTGGFQNAVVKDTVFYNNFSAMDIKSPIHDAGDLTRTHVNSNILLDGVHIAGSGNAIVTTFTDYTGKVTAATADSYIPHGITVTNTTFEDIGVAFLIKDGYNITWSDLTFRNVDSEARIMNVNAPDGWHRLSDGSQNIGGGYTTAPAQNLSADELWGFDAGAGSRSP
ncbi:right-handed parallel beta-helix repeat-containing protein [Leisingera aquaemixtae]|uniref:right-handed parallel beta-helix repeat-containing protein n=1 Tax=Leisingera aquaemixtae TaxID=1396826 RepID=UPI001C970297|nr:right-handed parallel beta-helix repeat-containing protein [Leisingera aquaemixtae]MBY6069552.1 right-handed parallel beta-helix repeat-containing protein [Leisingera aquaemixtae]